MGFGKDKRGLAKRWALLYKGRVLKTLKKGDRVEMTGYLVDADGRKGAETFQWRSSTSTSDHGAGSCEIICLKRLKKFAKVFQ